MADKSVGELIAAQSVTPTDLFVLEQNGTAKKLTGQTLENWLVSFADGHGGIQNIEKVTTSGLVDTYRITLADTTTFDFVVTNGRGVSSLEKTGTSGLVDTYTLAYSDGTTDTFTVTNGEKGDKGDNTYVWIKYASQQPTAASHSFGDLPDAWIGIYYGELNAAPNDWQLYSWYKILGETGDVGAPATLVSALVQYQVSSSGTVPPSGTWLDAVPSVPQGSYLWTKIQQTFNTGEPVVAYAVARMGIDGTGTVQSVCGAAPDTNGNVQLYISSIPSLQEELNSKLSSIADSSITANMLADGAVAEAKLADGAVTPDKLSASTKVRMFRPNLLDNWYFGKPVNQRGQMSYTATGYTIDRWAASSGSMTVEVGTDSIEVSVSSGTWQNINQAIEFPSRLNGQTVTLSVWIESGHNVVLSLKNVTTNAKHEKTIASPSGVISSTFDIAEDFAQDSDTVRFYVFITQGTSEAASATLKAVKLELGDTQTLAHQDADGNWVLNEIPNFAEQLARCQRYYITFGENSYLCAFPCYAKSSEMIRATIPTPVPMRVAPTLSTTLSNTRIYCGGAYTPTAVSVCWNPACITLTLTVSGADAGKSGIFRSTHESNVLAFSADL